MERFELVMTSTRVDRVGTQVTKEALEQSARDLGNRYLPLLNEHDWLQPIGRTMPGSVRACPDGAWELVAVAEIFEEGDELPVHPEREFRVSPPTHRGLAVRVGDEFIRDPQSRPIFKELRSILRVPPAFEGRRALEPPDLITISLAAALGAAFQGFIGELGADGYRQLRDVICRLYATRPHKAGARRFCLDLFFEHQGVEVILVQADPTAERIDEMVNTGLKELDALMPSILEEVPEVRRIVGEYGAGGLKIKYVVGADCVPRFFVPRAR